MILGSAAVKTCVHDAEGADRALKYGDVLECRRFLTYFKQTFSEPEFLNILKLQLKR